MNGKIERRKLETSKFYLIVSTLLNGFFGIVIVILVWMLIHSAMNQPTLLQPAFPIDKPIELGWDNGEIEVKNLRRVGELIALWTQHYTPSNAKNRFHKILPFVETSNFSEIKIKLDADVRRIKENGITQIFHPSHIKVKKSEIIVEGVASKLVRNTLLDTEKIIVKINYTYTPQHGFLLLGVTKKKIKG